MPPRANWTTSGMSQVPAPLNVRSRTPQAAELPAGSSNGAPEAPNSDAYFEDVDPRFAEPRRPPPQQRAVTPPPIRIHTAANGNHPYEDIPEGGRSPAESERSNFTSISQRGVNPRWVPPPPQASLMPTSYNAGPVPRRPVRPPMNDGLLGSNPDFALPATRGGRGGPGASSGNSPPRGGGGGGGGGGSGGPPGSMGMVPGSAYPAL